MLNDSGTDNINDGILDPPVGVPTNDGDAIFTALAVPPSTPVGPDDLIVTTLRFRALQTTPATEVHFLPTLGDFGVTRVFCETPPAQCIFTGDISAIAVVIVVGGFCSQDFDHNGRIDAADLAVLLAGWGPCQPACKPGDPPDTREADFDGDCDVDSADLADLLAVWGPCP